METSIPLKEEAGYTLFWSIITTFNILYILNILILKSTNQVLIDVIHFDDTRESVPIFGLTIACLITILSYYFFINLLKISDKKIWFHKIPSIWINIDHHTGLGKNWRFFHFILNIIFPMIANTYFWFIFFEGKAWANIENSEEFSLIGFVPIKYIIDWDAYRYGDYSQRFFHDQGYGGVSYIPFWQPLMMLGLSVILLVFFFKILHALFNEG